MSRIRVATAWLDGCSGCHMSFLDIDEKLIELADKVELVYSPLVDAKHIPENIDLALIEGAVSTEHDLERLRELRAKSRIVVALGDCAVTGNVSAMRDLFPIAELERRVYVENASEPGKLPSREVPRLLAKSKPLHEHVAIDLYAPGCPPSAQTIAAALDELLVGRMPDAAKLTRFGA